MMKMPKIWEIVQQFKDSCRGRGWKTSEAEDWIGINEEYHNFLWTRDIHPSSFRKIAASAKCVVCEGLSYRVVDSSCTAWLFSEAPSEALVKTVLENPEFSKKVALYDLSPVLEGKNTCAKLNYTESPVFQEFESFLQNEMKVKLKPLSPLSNPAIDSSEYKIVQLA
jgi:hypothetical protein